LPVTGHFLDTADLGHVEHLLDPPLPWLVLRQGILD
jgi:hypothetical protein